MTLSMAAVQVLVPKDPAVSTSVAPRWGGFRPASTSTVSGTLPLPPGELVASSTAPTTASLTWPAVAGVTGYRVERAAGTGGFTVVATLGADALTYSDIGLTTNTAYRYRVSSINDVGAGEASPVASVTPVMGTGLASPTNLSATRTTASRITLSWGGTDSTQAVLVQRSLDGGLTWTDLVTLTGSTRSYADNVQRATLYSYRLRASTFTSVSPFTGSVSLLTPPPDVRSILRTGIDEDSATVQWTASSGATGYVLEQSREGGAWVAVQTIAGGVVTTSIPGLEAGTVYQYRIRATNAGGSSGTTQVNGVLTLPTPPAGLTVETDEGPSVRISFSPVKGAATYVIERESDGRAWAPLATLQAGTTSYVDNLVAIGEEYIYRVKATNASGDSQYSEQASAAVTEAGALPVPIGLEVTPGLRGTVTLSWSVSGDMPSGSAFLVERMVKGVWRPFVTQSIDPGTGDGAASEFSVSLKGLSPAIPTRLRVVAAVGGERGTPSQALDVVLPPAQIRSVRRLVSLTPGNIALTWVAPVGSSFYRLERSDDRGATWTTVAEGFSAAAYSDGTAAPGTTYAYRASAGNAAGYGPASASLTVLTAPPVPAGLQVSPNAARTSAVLTWADVPGETGYRLQGSPDGTRWSVVASPRADATTATTRLRNFQFFRIASLNRSGTSAFSVPAGVPNAPAAPASVTAVPSAPAAVSGSAFSRVLLRLPSGSEEKDDNLVL